jgi:hypothetical protein
MDIRVALHHKTVYEYDRLVTPAPHSTSKIKVVDAI